MNHPSKRQCRRIDRAVAELDALLTAPGPNGRNYGSIHSVLQFVFKEYCQHVDGLNLLSQTDFKDYFLIIISFEDITSDVANVLLSVLYNASKADEFFGDLISSPIFDAVINIFLKDPANYYRSLRFLSVSLSKNKTSFIFPLQYVETIMSYCKCDTEDQDNGASNKNVIFKELVRFFPVYIKNQLTSDWYSFLEENDVSKVVTSFQDFFTIEKNNSPLLLKPQEVFLIAKVAMAAVKHDDTPVDLQNSFKEVLSDVIQWLSEEGSPKSLETMIDLYHPKTLHYMCYLAEKTRDSVFKEMLLHSHNPTTKVKVLTIYFNLCQQGSYRTKLVDKSFCGILIALIKDYTMINLTKSDGSQIILQLKIVSIVVSIFFIFNSGEKLIKFALDAGLYSALLSLANYIKVSSCHGPKTFAQCQTILPKAFLLMQKTTDYKLLNKNHCLTLVSILKIFSSINCLNYLLYLSFTVQFTHLIHNSFVSIVYHELNCSSLSTLDQHFDHKPLRSAPSAMKKISNLPYCGKMILSNVLHSLEASALSSPQALSESVLLLRKNTLINEIFKNNVIPNILEKPVNDINIYSALLGNFSILLKWLLSVCALDQSFLNDGIVDIKDTQDQIPIIITNGEIEIVIDRSFLVKSSPVLSNMFKHSFRERTESCIRLPYLSDKTMLCLKDIFSYDQIKIKFSDSHDFFSEHCYPWSAAHELSLFSIMFEIPRVFKVIVGCLIHEYQFRDVKFPILGMKLIFRELFFQIGDPLLKQFCLVKSQA